MYSKALVLSTLLFSQLGQAEEALTLTFKQLTMETAVHIAQATVLSCREKGY